MGIGIRYDLEKALSFGRRIFCVKAKVGKAAMTSEVPTKRRVTDTFAVRLAHRLTATHKRDGIQP